MNLTNLIDLYLGVSIKGRGGGGLIFGMLIGLVSRAYIRGTNIWRGGLLAGFYGI